MAILEGLPAAGADIIELGMPFTDPMADGPSIQASSLRALASGHTLSKTLDMVRAFRAGDQDTPIVLMGYYNPIYVYGNEAFLDDARVAGVDGLIIVDLPPEEDEELCLPALARGLNFIRLATPTTDDRRLPRVLANTSGFVYYVSITGITGAKGAAATTTGEAVARLQRHTELPVAASIAPPRSWSAPSSTTSTRQTRTPNPSNGPNPPMTSSPPSSGSASEQSKPLNSRRKSCELRNRDTSVFRR